MTVCSVAPCSTTDTATAMCDPERFLLSQSLWPSQTTAATPTTSAPPGVGSRPAPSISLFYARVCLLRAYLSVLFSQPSQPKNTLLSLLILSLCGYWLLIVKSDDGFIGYGLCFSSVVLCWCWCWNFKWTMRVGFYCMIGRVEKNEKSRIRGSKEAWGLIL